MAFRWFAGVQLMLVVIDHPEHFCAYKAEEESSTVYFRDNIHYKRAEAAKASLLR